MSTELKQYEVTQEKVCHARLLKCQSEVTPDFTLGEVRSVVNEFKAGKSIDPTGVVREVFMNAGDEFLKSLIRMANYNVFKKQKKFPHEWEKMWIRTLRKQKGSMKDLNNHRGVFIVNISSLIFQKLSKNRILPILTKNMPQFQTGGMNSKGVTDNVFILRGIVDHSKYLGKELCVTFYDIEKCFDSLWLCDCLNSLWENGIQNDLLYLIYLLNHRARIQVKSLLGMTDTFTLTDITKQGTIIGPILNNCSLDRICVEGQGYQLGSAYIKPLEYVDDIADPNNGFEEAIGSNADIERIETERIHFSDDKSKLLKVNNKSTSKTITVNGVPLKLPDCYKYLGDYFDEKGIIVN